MEQNGRPDADVFVDDVRAQLHPFGAALMFGQTVPLPRGVQPSPNQQPNVLPVTSVRMSTEHLKAAIILLWKQVTPLEQQSGLRFELPDAFLTGIGVDRATWSAFWYGEVAPNEIAVPAPPTESAPVASPVA